MLAVNGETRDYNDTGKPKTTRKFRYEYNAQQRPVKVFDRESNTLIAQYQYNSFGARIKKVAYKHSGNTSRKTITYYLYDGRKLAAEISEGGDVLAQYLYYKGQVVAKLQNRDVFAVHTDHLGTPKAVTDQNKSVVWSAEYTPFGEASVEVGNITLNLRLPGQYFDAETGTHYNYYRDYEPGTGRYTQSDPIGLAGGLNTYAYVTNNPLGLVDVLGLQAGPAPSTGAPAPAPLPEFLPGAANDPYYGSTPGSNAIAEILRVAGYAIPGSTVLRAAGLIANVLLLGGDTPEGTEVGPPRAEDFSAVQDEIRLFAPKYFDTRSTEYELSWPAFYDLLNALNGVQQEYVTEINDLLQNPVCPTPDTVDLYKRAKDGINFRIAIANLVTGSNQPTTDDVVDRQFRAYQAEGGELSFEDWLVVGMPAAGASQQLAIQRRMSEIAQTVRQEFIDDPEALIDSLSEAEMEAIARAHESGGKGKVQQLVRAYFGTQLEIRMAELMEADPLLTDLQWTQRGSNSVDWIWEDAGTGDRVTYDVTAGSNSSIQRHIDRGQIDVIVTYNSLSYGEAIGLADAIVAHLQLQFGG